MRTYANYSFHLQVAAKIEGGGSKRSLEEGPEPIAKKQASLDSYPIQPPQQQQPPVMRYTKMYIRPCGPSLAYSCAFHYNTSEKVLWPQKY